MSTPAPTDADLSASVHKSQLEHKLVVGADRRLVAVILVTIFLMSAVLHNYWLLFAYAPVHLGLWLATRGDPDRVDIYLKYRHQGDYYEPRVHLDARNPRPEGFGRGTLC